MRDLLNSKEAFLDALFLSELVVLLITLSKGTEIKTYELFCLLLVFCEESKPHVQAVSEIQICTGSNCLQR